MLNGKKVIAFVPASGTGSRMNLKMPKQFVTIREIPICFYPIVLLQNTERIDQIVLAVPDGWVEYASAYSAHLGISKMASIVVGGKSLPETLRNMFLAENPSSQSYVGMVFDGDRMIFDDVIDRALDNFQNTGNTTIPYFNPYEAGFYLDGSDVQTINELSLDRKKVHLVSPPIVYASETISNAIKHSTMNCMLDTYLHEIVIGLGYPISFIPCSRYNIKVTEPGDIEVVSALLPKNGVNCLH